MSKTQNLESKYRKISHMAAALTQLMQDLQRDVTAVAHIDSHHEPYISLSDMEDSLTEGIMGLEALVQADKKEPFSV